MNALPCLCCGCLTIGERAAFEICPVCFWEDDAYINLADTALSSLYDGQDTSLEKLLDVRSAANNGLTLRQGRANYLACGACEQSLLPHVRKPHAEELPR